MYFDNEVFIQDDAPYKKRFYTLMDYSDWGIESRSRNRIQHKAYHSL